MLDLIKTLIHEAVASMRAAPFAEEDPELDPNQGKGLLSMYFDRNKMITLCKKYIERYGFASTKHDEKSSYERMLRYIGTDKTLSRIEADDAFCSEFMDALKQNKIPIRNALLLNQASSALHSPKMKVMALKYIVPVVDAYMQFASQSKSQVVDAEGTMLFKKMKLKQVKSDSSHRLNSQKGRDPRFSANSDSYIFQDPKGNYFTKRGSPPAILMRTSQSRGTLLATSPYEMRYDDSFSFQGKVVRSYVNSQGVTINVLDSLQPIAKN